MKLKSIIAFTILLLIGSCNKEEPQENLPESPFTEFIGTWQKVSHLVDNVDISDQGFQYMIIDEDENSTDLKTTGFLKMDIEDEGSPSSFELTSNQNEIFIVTETISFICNYGFTQSGSMTLDDSDETYSDLSTWIRL